ncbi:MAG: sugar phosphate isomerase/epimerase [Gemmatimonadota bacterium]
MIRLSMMARETTTTRIDSALDLARRLELDGVDLHLGGMSRDPEYLRQLKLGCLRRGLTIGYLGGGTFVGPPEEAAARLAQGKADVDLAAQLGAQLLRVFARHRWPETEAEQEALWRPMIASFQELAEYAAARHVAVGLQNHDESSFAMAAWQVKRILEEVGRDNFTFIMDTGQWQGAIGSHPRGERDPQVDLYEDYLRPTAPLAAYVRAKIYEIDGGQEEWLDYGRILAILREARYNGALGMVFELGDRNACDFERAAELATRHLREIIAWTCGAA